LPSSDTDTPEVDETPRDEAREELLAAFTAELGDAIVGSHIRPGADLWLRVERDAWQELATVAQRKLRFEFFDFLSAIDWLPSPFARDMDSQEDLIVHGREDKDAPVMAQGYAGGTTRLQVLARLMSLPREMGINLKVDVPDDDPSVPTWSGTFGGANWHERETWEMYGIDFPGHPNLIKLYLPGAFEGFPLRKDFPLLSRRVKPWPGIVDVEPMPGNDDAEAGA